MAWWAPVCGKKYCPCSLTRHPQITVEAPFGACLILPLRQLGSNWMDLAFELWGAVACSLALGPLFGSCIHLVVSFYQFCIFLLVTPAMDSCHMIFGSCTSQVLPFTLCSKIPLSLQIAVCVCVCVCVQDGIYILRIYKDLRPSPPWALRLRWGLAAWPFEQNPWGRLLASVTWVWAVTAYPPHLFSFSPLSKLLPSVNHYSLGFGRDWLLRFGVTYLPCKYTPKNWIV